MKRSITLISAVVFGMFVSRAQITIHPYDVVLAGKVLYQATDTTKPLTVGSINPGPAGANKTWNFANLLSDVVDTLYITNPAWLPSGASFPTSNLAAMAPDSSAFFLENLASGLYILGADGDPTGQGQTVVKFNPKEQMTSFPNTYNSTFQNTSGFDMKIPFTLITGFDSVRFKEIKSKDVLTDGWGSITTPLGTYNSIRQKGEVITTDSIWLRSVFPPMWNFFQVTIDTSYHFSWWASGVGLPLLEFDSLKGDTIQNIVWLKTLPVIGAVNENPALSTVKAYPNPSAGTVNLTIPSAVKEYKAELYTLTGEKVKTTSVAGAKENSLDLSALPNGTYLLRISTSEGSITRKLILNR